MASRARKLREKALDISASQGGAISRTQLLQLGLSCSGIRSWVEASKLHRVYRGSYSISREIEHETVWWAAVLSAGESCVISHMSALHLWGIETRSGPTEVTRKSSGGRRSTLRSPAEPGINTASVKGYIRIPALKIHHSRRFEPADTTIRMSIPVTSVARTLVDVSGLVSRAKLESLLHEAGRRQLLKLDEVRSAIGSGRGRTGVGLLREIVDGWDPRLAPTRNQLEGRFFSLCRGRNLPLPLVNRIVAGREVDFFFPEFGLIVETDGARDHSRPHGIERDKERDSYLQLRGFLVLRLTWNMLKFEPEKSVQKVIDHLELCRRQGRRADEGWGSASIGRW